MVNWRGLNMRRSPTDGATARRTQAAASSIGDVRMALPCIASRSIESLSFVFRVHGYLRRNGPAASAVRKQRSAFYRAVWEAAAAAVGATVTSLDGSMMEIRCKGVRLLVRDNVTSLDDPVTLDVAGNKPLVHRLLMEEQIPVPRHLVCRRDDLMTARRCVAVLGGLCVIKPALAGSAGAGITTGVREGQHLALAMARAGAYSRDVVIEEQVNGDNYRLLYLDGDLVDAILRRPPMVRGDGRSTIRRLLIAENAERIAKGTDAAQSLITIDEDLRNTLRARGYHLGSVPAAHAAVQLKTVINDNRRDENEAASDRLCASIVETGSAAARALGVRLAGVDVITNDPSFPLSESGGVVLEVNTTPGFFYHYTGTGGAQVAASILRRLAEAAE